MKQSILLTMLVYGFVCLDVAAMSDRESKEAASLSVIPATIARANRVQFQVNGTKVGPFDLSHVAPADEVKIFDIKNVDDSYVVVGIIYKEKNDNRFFALEFKRDWGFSKEIFNEVRGYSPGVKFRPSTEWIKIINTPADSFNRPYTSILLGGVAKTDKQYLPVIQFDLGYHKWHERFPFWSFDINKEAGYSRAIINRITDVRIENSYYLTVVTGREISLTLHLSHVDPGFPTIKTIKEDLTIAPVSKN